MGRQQPRSGLGAARGHGQVTKSSPAHRRRARAGGAPGPRGARLQRRRRREAFIKCHAGADGRRALRDALAAALSAPARPEWGDDDSEHAASQQSRRVRASTTNRRRRRQQPMSTATGGNRAQRLRGRRRRAQEKYHLQRSPGFVFLCNRLSRGEGTLASFLGGTRASIMEKHITASTRSSLGRSTTRSRPRPHASGAAR